MIVPVSAAWVLVTLPAPPPAAGAVLRAADSVVAHDTEVVDRVGLKAREGHRDRNVIAAAGREIDTDDSFAEDARASRRAAVCSGCPVVEVIDGAAEGPE